MEKKYYTDNFEQFLKETTDDFRMYPSKRVWTSIYNNLHPGRKWPSLAICLLLVSSMLYMGIAHKNVTGGTSLENKNIGSIAAIPSSKLAADKPAITSSYEAIETLINEDSEPGPNAVPVKKSSISNLPAKIPNAAIAGSLISEPVTNNFKPVTSESSNPVSIKPALNEAIPGTLDAEISTLQEYKSTVTNQLDQAELKNIDRMNSLAMESKKNNPVKKIHVDVNKLNKTDKEWIEDFAFHNKPKNKFRGFAYQFYATPSIGYRTLTKKMSDDRVFSPSSITTSGRMNSDVHSSLNQYPSLNLEIGGTLLYSVSKGIRLKGGLQINYTNYKIRAYGLKHTTLTTLLIADPNSGAPELSSRSSSLANTPYNAANKKLNSNTYQLSIPVGADIRLAGKNRLQWFAGATVQPTFIAGGNGYLISSDMKNYVYDASFLRKWNLNGAIETFFSYKIKNGMVLNAGPQLRYQFYSTYKDKYSYEEKLFNLGMKMGITRNF